MGRTANRAILVPASWRRKIPASLVLPAYGKKPVQVFIANHPAGKHYKQQLDDALEKMPGLEQVVLVLPRSMENSAAVNEWPSSLYQKGKQVVLVGLLFADEFAELTDLFGQQSTRKQACYVTCQYEPPYTDSLENWQRAGAFAFHPGDYTRDEMLLELKQMKGSWLYFGHGSRGELNGYSSLNAGLLTANLPAKPLDLVAWFSCSTLQKSAAENLAIAYYKTGATRCLMAAKGKPSTAQNTLLSSELLQQLQCRQSKSFGHLLLDIAKRSPEMKEFIHNNYRILGVPWSRIFLTN